MATAAARAKQPAAGSGTNAMLSNASNTPVGTTRIEAMYEPEVMGRTAVSSLTIAP